MSSSTQRSVPFGPLPNPDRDYMTDRSVSTLGDAMAQVDAEAREEYHRAGEPEGWLESPTLLDWWCSR